MNQSSSTYSRLVIVRIFLLGILFVAKNCEARTEADFDAVVTHSYRNSIIKGEMASSTLRRNNNRKLSTKKSTKNKIEFEPTCISASTLETGDESKSSKSKSKSKSKSSRDDCICPCCDEVTCDFILDDDSPIETDDDLAEYGICPPSECSYEGSDFATCCSNFGCEYGGCHRCRNRDRQLNEGALQANRTKEELEYGLLVQVETDETDNLNWIEAHAKEMLARTVQGDATREWDALFAAYFKHAPEEIQMECEHEENRMQCLFTSLTNCGKDLILAQSAYHDEIIETIKSTGHHGVWSHHNIPESCILEDLEEDDVEEEDAGDV